jgi:hypothetical protein
MFDFSQSKVKCPVIGVRVHVAKALLGAREREGITGDEVAVLCRAVDYIKALEAEVTRLRSVSVDISNTITSTEGAKDVAESVGRGFLGGLFRS